MQGYTGGDSSGSEDEDMDSEDEEIDMGEVSHNPSLRFNHSHHSTASLINSWQIPKVLQP